MTTPTREPLVGLAERLRAVTQADREAALALRTVVEGARSGGEQALYRCGAHDHTREVQAFAQHRATALEEQSRRVEELEAALRGLLSDEAGDVSHNLDGVLEDLRGRFKPDDGGVCAATIERVIVQLEAARTALSPSDTVEKGEGA